MLVTRRLITQDGNILFPCILLGHYRAFIVLSIVISHSRRQAKRVRGRDAREPLSSFMAQNVFCLDRLIIMIISRLKDHRNANSVLDVRLHVVITSFCPFCLITRSILHFVSRHSRGEHVGQKRGFQKNGRRLWKEFWFICKKRFFARCCLFACCCLYTNNGLKIFASWASRSSGSPLLPVAMDLDALFPGSLVA